MGSLAFCGHSRTKENTAKRTVKSRLLSVLRLIDGFELSAVKLLLSSGQVNEYVRERERERDRDRDRQRQTDTETDRVRDRD